MSFAAKLFISIGETAAFYTLRETYLHDVYVGAKRFSEVRSFHHFNLSQDPAAAIEKAAEASLHLGVPFEGTTVEKLGEQLREIQRADAAELERRERQEREWTEARKRLQEEWNLAMCERAAYGFVPGSRGGNSGMHLLTLPRSYINWLLDKRAEFELGSPMRVLAEHANFFYAERALPVPGTAVIGEPGKRIEFEATCVRQFALDGFYGRTYISTLVEHHTGACLVVFSGSFKPAVEDVVRGKATVKEHKEYRGQPQTIIQRVKEIAA